jgi:hypothetical protein
MVMLIPIFLSSNVCAFESDEHKRLGDLSYHLALKTFCQQNSGTELCAQYLAKPSAATLFYDSLKDQFKVDAAIPSTPAMLSYGDVVMCVDYFLTPEKLIGGRERNLIRPAQDPALSGEMPGLYPTDRTQLDLAVSVRCDPSWTNFEGARAGHVNHNHFQLEMLLAQRSNHVVALFLRAKENKLFSALVMNAISDHYLHDSFAPGHITTARSKMSDVIANSYHDFQNKNGIEVKIDLVQLRKFATLRHNDSDADQMKNILEMLGEGEPARHFFSCGENISKCPNKEKFASKEGVSARLAKIKSFIEAPASTTTSTEPFRGDKQLWAQNQDVQRFVMLLSGIRSIYDVLESSPAHDSVAISFTDSFDANAWEWSEDGIDKHPNPVRPLTSLSLPSSTMTAKIGAVNYAVERRFSDRGESPSKNRIDNRSMDPIFGISLGIDNMTFGDSQNRRVVGLEKVVGGLTLAHGLLAKVGALGNLAITAGVQGYTGPGPDGFGPTARFLLVMPETETSASVQLRYLKVRAPGGTTEWHPTIGLRFDMGFTSFLTMYLQGGRDWAAQRDGSVRSGYSVGAGVQLGSAKCNIPVVKYVGGCP